MFHVYALRQASLVGALLLLASLASGCATTRDAPTSALQSARQAIANAEQVGAAREAPFDLRRARDRYDAAEEAVDDENMLQAEWLAHEAAVLAELAYSRSQMLTAKRVNEELQQTTEMLKEELSRQRGGRS